MARRPSTVSTTSRVSSNVRIDSGPSDYFEGSLSNVNGRARLPSRTSPITLAKYQTDDRRIDPDELFTQRTVAEVKAFQLQLRSALQRFALQLLTDCRTDADAKQEELRLMVGCVCGFTSSAQSPELPEFTPESQGAIPRSPTGFHFHYIHCTIIQTRHRCFGRDKRYHPLAGTASSAEESISCEQRG